MTIDEIKNIILEIRDFRKETMTSISKILDKLDTQSERITSVEKDFVHLSEKADERDGRVHKDVDSCLESLRKFKEEEMPGLVKTFVKQESLHIKYWAIINFLGVVAVLFWSVRDFIAAILTRP